MKMIVEQTKYYPYRMEYDPKEKKFTCTENESLMHRRQFDYPYGWIKESGTPPEPHCDCMLMSEDDFQLGDEIDIKIIGVFKRNDGDHKYIVVQEKRNIEDISELSKQELDALKKLYPRMGAGEGWFGKREAQGYYQKCDRVL